MKKIVFIILLCTLCQAEDISSLYNRANILQNQHEYLEAAVLFEQVYEKDSGSKWADASLYMTGECLFSAGKYQEALEKGYLKLLSVYKNSDLSEDASYMTGQCYLRIGEKQQASRHYTEFLKKYPGSSWAKEIRGIVDSVTPVKKQEIIDEYSPDYEQEILAKALSYHSQNDFENAETLYLTLLKKYPDSKNAGKYNFLLAELCGLNQKYAESLVYYRRAISSGSRSIQSESQYKIGETCYHINDYKNAIVSYEILVKDYPESDWVIDSLYMIADCRQKLGQYRQARDVYTAILNRYPNTFWAEDIRNNLVSLDKLLAPPVVAEVKKPGFEEKKPEKQTVNSIAALSQTVSVTNSSDETKKQELPQPKLSIANSDAAEMTARKKLSAARYHYETGMRYKKMKKYYLAAEELKKCIDYGSSYEDVFWELGLILNQLKKFDMSIFYLEKEIASRPDNIGAHSLTAYLYYVKGNYGKAIERYNYICEHSKIQEERKNAEYAIKNIKKHMF